VPVLVGTPNTRFIHNLPGNTQITQNIRQVTKSVDPRELATWTLVERIGASLSSYSRSTILSTTRCNA